MQNRLGFLYGKTILENSDLDRWLAVSEFSDSILKAVDSGDNINDVTILLLCEKILSENLNSDAICGVSRSILSDITAKLRSSIEDFKFKPNWLREEFPSVWKSVKSMSSDDGFVIIPIQMGRFIQVLKYMSSVGNVSVMDIDPSGIGYATVSFSNLMLNGSFKTNELFGRLRFCDSITVIPNGNCVEVSITVSNLVMEYSEFYSRRRPKRAWILQWNKELESNLKEGDGNSSGVET